MYVCIYIYIYGLCTRSRRGGARVEVRTVVAVRYIFREFWDVVFEDVGFEHNSRLTLNN